MLNFRMYVGDDLWFGLEGASLDQYQQVFIKEANCSSVTVVTPKEVVPLPLSDNPPKVDLGFMGISMVSRPNAVYSGCFDVGIDCPDEIRVLRGRVYRRNLNV